MEVEGDGGWGCTVKDVGYGYDGCGQYVGREHKDGISPKVRGAEAERRDDAKVQCAGGAGAGGRGTVGAVTVGIGAIMPFFVLHECFVRKLILLFLERGKLHPVVLVANVIVVVVFVTAVEM